MSAIARLAAAIEDRYRIDRELGVGGMASVHLAHDLKHDREVAVKVLHPDLAAALGAERFLAEIRTTAKLQHPHILPLLDSGEAAGLLYYVMPLVSGESLRARLDRERQLPIDDAVRLAREVASALDYAHRQGVIHRDIKPENILLHDGSALVADFGIALAVQTAGGERMTQTGLSLGTPQYMSPEQAMGERSIDARSDVYSLAAVTYEMLAGEPPFTGATVQAVVAKVISAEPQDVGSIRRNVSPAVARTVHRGLEKVPADRFGSAAAFSSALVDTTVPSPVTGTMARNANSAPGWRRLARAAAPWTGAAIVGLAAFVVGRNLAGDDDAVDRRPVIATLLPDEGEDWAGSGVHMAISPDGREVAIVSRRDGRSRIILRSLDSLNSRELSQTDGAYYLFWSPEGRRLGFFADFQLKVMDLQSGTVRPLCPAARPGGASWGADDVILYLPERGVGLHRVSASGPPCEKLAIATPPQAIDGKPRFLPDGRHFVSATDLEAWLGSVDGDSLTKLTDVQRMRPVVAGPDYLLYRPRGTQGNIVAQRIDVRARRLVGEPFRILGAVSTPGGNTALAASENGVLIARLSPEGGDARLLGRFERNGAARDTMALTGARAGRTYGMHSLSRDGRRLALGGWEIVVLDLSRGVPTVLARSPEGRVMRDPVWSPGDTAIAYVTGDSGLSRIAVVDTRTGESRIVFTAVAGRAIDTRDWSTDGRYLLFNYLAGGGSPWTEPWMLDLVQGEAGRIFSEDAHLFDPRLSPDGKWVAYENRSGGDGVVFIRPFRAAGSPVRVSTGNGENPRWSRNGAELFYTTEAGVMAVRVPREGAAVSAPALALDVAAMRAVAPSFTGGFLYDPAPDGRGFVGSVTRPPPVQFTLVLDWWYLLPPEARPR